MKKVIPVSRLSRGEDKANNAPTPGLLGTMAGGAAVRTPVMFGSGQRSVYASDTL